MLTVNPSTHKVNFTERRVIDSHLAQQPSYQTLRRNVVATFAISSVVSGLIFTWVVTRPGLRTFWFTYPEYWVLPSKQFALLAPGALFLNLASAYTISLLKGWLDFSRSRSIIGLAITATLPFLFWIVAPFGLLLGYLLFRILLVILLTVSLWVITRRWSWGVAGLMLVAALVTPFLLSVLLAFFGSLSVEAFEAWQCMVSSLSLSILFAWWLVKSWREPAPARLTVE